MVKRPQNKTLREVVQYLEFIGLQVSGSNVDPETGVRDFGCRDFSAEEVVKYRKLYEEDSITFSSRMEEYING